jgi:protein TonB
MTATDPVKKQQDSFPREVLPSLAVHALVVMSLLSFGGPLVRMQKAIVVDLSRDGTPTAHGGSPVSALPVHSPPHDVRGETRQAPEKPSQAEQLAVDENTKREAPLPLAPQGNDPRSLRDDLQASHWSGNGANTSAEQGASLLSRTAGSRRLQDSGTPRATDQVPALTPGHATPYGGSTGDPVYLQTHFAHIRALVQQRAVYPPLARKMGWEGRGTIAFTVTTDGSVKDVRIIRTTGYDLLDRSAADAVLEASPFPGPPVEARLIIPIGYRLQ